MVTRNNLILGIYRKTPKKLLHKIGRLPILKGLRDKILRQEGAYKEVIVDIHKNYEGYDVAFKFVAAIKVAATAKNKGIESTLLKNSIKLLKQYKKDKKELTILDIGANFGYLSLVWSNTVAKQGTVIAFEPNKKVYSSFKKAIQLNALDTSIQLQHLAVGAETKKIMLYLNNTTSNTRDIGLAMAYDEVQMVSVDTYFNEHAIPQCDLIKIDVDGIELDILKGSIETIKKFRPLLIVETNNDGKIVDFFQALNYKILDMNLEPYKDDKPLPLNVFCIPETHDTSF